MDIGKEDEEATQAPIPGTRPIKRELPATPVVEPVKEPEKV